MKREALHPVTRRLIVIRGLRSLGQGAMVVDLTLYLKALHWHAVAIGGVVSGAGLIGAALILVVGVLSDRFGRKPFLLIYECLTVLSALAATFSTQAILLSAAIVIGGFGRGQSGAAGPFSPAEQAWLARYVQQANRGRVFSLNNAVGFIGMAVGALIGGAPHLLQPVLPGPAAYRPIFVLIMVLSIVCMFILVGTVEEARDVEISGGKQRLPDAEPQSQSAAAERTIRRRENGSLLKLAAVNTLNGLAVGLTGPMMAYWFADRYGVGVGAIGLTLSASFLLTGVASIGSGLLADRFGMVKSVTYMRLVGSAMMLALPFLPTFSSASAIYVLRSAINRGTQGNRSALGASLTRDSRRGFATSINALSMRLPASIGPTLTGVMFEAGALSLPLFLTGGLQIVNALLYQWVFRSYDHPAPGQPAA